LNPPETKDGLFSASGLTKSYVTVVLDQVDFDLRRGEVHALVGENGAGKSTLARIIAGLTAPSAGSMQLNAQPFAPASRKESEQRGVRMVMQELNLVGNLTIAESIFIDQLPHRFGWIDYAMLNRMAQQALAPVGLGELEPGRRIFSLGVGQQQLVEIAAGLSRQCDVFILDEPTASLTDPEIELLFGQIARLKARGVGLIYISHRMEEIKRVADRISVLRDGRMVATRPASEIALDEIVRLMVGRDLGEAIQRQREPPGPVILRAEGLRRGTVVRDVSFEVRRGEILGFAGLMGSGRTETMRLIFGADRAEGGRVFLRDEAIPARIDSPRDAVRQGIALLTEDRKEQGLLLPRPVRENISMTALGRLSNWLGWIRQDAERNTATQWADSLRVRCHSVEQRAGELSGGNQQKVVIAKWLYRDCDILIFDEPTRGIDVGAKFEIYQLLAELAERGKAIIVVSSDLKELMALCDRIAVMSAGRLVADLTREEWSQDKIMAAALSGHIEKANE
jgi:ribose transport system ATP-binding protein